MKVEDLVALPIADVVPPSGLDDLVSRVLAEQGESGEREIASAIGRVGGEWSAAVATDRGCRLVTARFHDGAWTHQAEFVRWTAARPVELWLAGTSPMDIGLMAFVGERRLRLDAKGVLIGPLLELIRVWDSRIDHVASGPIRGVALLEFQGGLFDGLTFKHEGRGPLLDVISGDAFSVSTGSYVRHGRVLAGGPFAMVWTARQGVDSQVDDVESGGGE